jgi:hypothetical protein
VHGENNYIIYGQSFFSVQLGVESLICWGEYYWGKILLDRWDNNWVTRENSRHPRTPNQNCTNKIQNTTNEEVNRKEIDSKKFIIKPFFSVSVSRTIYSYL